MSKKKPLDLYQSDEEHILATLMNELSNNPQLQSSNLLKNENTKQFSKQFLNQVITKFDSSQLTDPSKKVMESILSLWHLLTKDLMQGGFSTKDTAMLIYAFKTSIQSLKASNNLSKESPLYNSEPLLDLLGILTFEMYSLENERLISRQNEQINYLQNQESKLSTELIGNSIAMKHVYKAIGLVLDNDLSVLLEGESGTGKDLIATTIHNNSKRQKKPMITINCGAIPKELIESELFGHEKGAFTGATEKRLGKFELADGGTLFLDEIGELPLDLQVKLLRVLQNKQIERIGSERSIKVDVRIIAATNQSLKQKVDDKTFRLDLYYRLNIFPIHIPPLRNRKEDIHALAHFFIQKYSKELSITSPTITNDALLFLENQSWEGNIRELENVIQRSLVIAQGASITSSTLSILPGQHVSSLTEQKVELLTEPSKEVLPLEMVEKQTIEHAIKIKKGNLLQVAKALKISRTTLYSKIKKYNIKLDS
ncbi:hypothetical protein CL647_05200 [bacterium]|nr:hypothetical protein [Actinomycetota bacterium]MBE33485.1 hypothetical protein [bacterium]|tara:strand:+ start:17988 stop:19439 length:1452 start_codon:yes stop_codon:yes gene_type:complete